MTIPPLSGHFGPRQRLAAAVQNRGLPQVLLFEGAQGVGRQRLALWLAQLLFCEKRLAEPCGTCRGCGRVAALAHPDLHWFVPIPRPKATDPDKAVDEAAETLGEVMAERRENPLYSAPEGMASHTIASVRLLQRRAALKSVEGGPTVFIVGDAERLVPQESSPEAANALLKLLEEPPPKTWFVLTATDARRLLPTIRSRVVPLRLGRLTDNEVREFLGAHAGLKGAALEEAVKQAEGAIGAALGGDAEGAEKAQRAAAAVIAAAAGGPAVWAERVLQQNPFSARGDFSAMLDALSGTLGDAVRATTGLTPRQPLPAALERHREPARLLEALQAIDSAKEAAQGNVNPQLLLAELGEDLSRCL